MDRGEGKGTREENRTLLSIPGELKQRIEVAILSAWEKEERSENNP
jgi:hypothetical protein